MKLVLYLTAVCCVCGLAGASVQSTTFRKIKELVQKHEQREFETHLKDRLLREGKGDRFQTPRDQYLKQPLDHFNPAIRGTYKQRFWVNDEYWSKRADGPVFLYIGGEGALSARAVLAGHHVAMARKYGALLVAVEHRYYGASINDDGLELDNIHYLSSQQALADLATFHGYAVKTYSLSDRNTWICFGGSYPGALSAWFRLKYPHLVYGAIASSAPVRARTNFQGYNHVVGQSLGDPVVNGSKQCVTNVHQAFVYIDALLSSRQFAKLEKDFLSCKPLDDAYDVFQFVNNLAGGFMGVVQYNNIVPGLDVGSVCKEMLEPGIAYDNLVKLSKTFLQQTGEKCMDNSWKSFINDMMNTTVDRTSGGAGLRQWIYQTCTQFGYYQTCDKGTGCPFSYRQNLEPNLDICSDVFHVNTWDVNGRVQFSNEYYGSDQPRGSRIVFVNGSIDPWHALSVLTDEIGTEIAIYINGTAHCANMADDKPSDPPSLRQARVEISSRIRHWLQQARLQSR